MAILFALHTFLNTVAGRSVVLFSDNTGAQHSTAKGSARAADQCALVHSIWELAYVNKFKLWVERVPSLTCSAVVAKRPKTIPPRTAQTPKGIPSGPGHDFFGLNTASL